MADPVGVGPGPTAPTPYRVRERRRETHDTYTLALEPVDRSLRPAAPGQFHMLWSFGIGEVPISISGLPETDGAVLHTIRSVGTVTGALCDADAGAVVGVRGPYGTSWDLDDAAGHDVVIVAGGIGLAPLRTAVTQILAERDRFGRVALLVGARAPGEIVFTNELPRWRSAGIDVQVTVDSATPDWRGDVGVVTKLFPRIDVDGANARAFVCGPEIMIRFAAAGLEELGVAPGRIRIAMERNMKCAIGHCGHCLFGPMFVCKDGSVFPYDVMAPYLAVREL
jgi:NAD(P)H-flavin reductase